MKRFGAFSLRARIILLGLILVAPLIFVFVIRSEGDAEREFAAARDHATLLVERANGDYSDLLLKALTVVDVVAKSPLAAGDDMAGCDRFVNAVRSSYSWANTLFVADAQGDKICATSGEEKPQSVAERDWFKRLMATKQPVVSDYLVGFASQRPQIAAAQPILDGQGRVFRVVAIGVDLAAFNAQLTGEAADPDASVTILDREGTVVGRYPEKDDFLGKRFPNNDFVARVLRDRSGQAEADGIAGVRRFFAFQPFGDTSLTIAIGIAKQPIVDKIDGQLRHDLAILAAIVFVCIAGALAGAERLILTPLKKLGDAAAAIGEGRFDAARGMTGGAPELERTLGAIGDMAGLLDRREQELKASELRYRMLAENTTDIIFLHDADGRPSYVSPACRRILGYEPEELAILPPEAFVHPDDAAGIAGKYFEISPEHPEFSSTHRLRRKDGEYIWVEAIFRLIPGAVGAGGGIIATTRDITARRLAEETLRESEARFRGQFDTAAHGIALVSPDGRWLRANPALCRMIGYSESELLGSDFQTVTHPDDLDADLAQVKAVLAGDIHTYQMEKRYLHKDGHVIWVLLSVSLVRSTEGRPIYFVSQIQDITDRKRAEEALRENESRYRTLADNATDLITLQDLELRPLYVSPASRRMLGYDPEKVMGLTAENLMHPDDAAPFVDACRSLSEDAPRAWSVHRLRRHDGSYVWVEASLQRIPPDEDEPARILTVVRDITERKLAEQATEDLRRLLSDAIEAMQDGIAVYDADDRLALFNSALRKHRVEDQDVFTVGRAYEDIVRVYWTALRGDRGDFEDYVKRGLERHQRGDGYPWEVQDKDGNWLLTRHFRTRDGGILTVSTDITALKKAEAEALRAQELVSDAIEAMQDAISLYDAGDRLVLANKALLQRSPRFAEFLRDGTTFEGIVRGFWGTELAAPDSQAFEGFIARRIAHFRAGDGSPFETENSEGEWYATRHFRTSDGGAISVSANVTVAKKVSDEIEAARDAAEAANQAKSAFLASMSHEIRTPMNGVLGFADLLLETDLSALQRRHLRGIQEAGKSLLALINDILDLSKIEAGKLEVERVPMSPDAIVDGAVSILRSQFAAKAIDLRFEHASDVPVWIEGDPTRVRQILLNLMSNALKFTDRGHVTVRSSFERGDSGDRLRFEVEDTGIGIPADRQHLLFRDFSQIDRSTTRRFGGTGLGLAICKRLAGAMGGEIGVISDSGAGSTFWFTVAGARTAAPEAVEPIPVGDSYLPARVLVAEDLPMNQLVIEGYLRRTGNEVVFAANGREAIAALKADRFDLVLMDVEMPEMDGIAATRAIRGSDGPMRDVPIVALTANALLEDAALCKAAGMNDFLSKPIDRSALYAMIARWARRQDRQDGDAGPIRVRSQILDPAVVDELESLLGKEKAAEFVEMSRSAIVAMVPIFVAWSDEAEVAREAHKLISIAGNIGCKELVDLSREMATVNGDGAGNRNMRDKLVAALERAMAALEVRFPAV
jgi:two-component system sensor histidine kinase/response regulator